MKTVSLIIDSKRIFAEEGTTILEAAKQNGIEIPTLCYHPRLKPLGHCRVCVVDIEGFNKPITSCDNPVVEGMVVTTNTPAIQKMREEIISLSLATHPYKDCLTCERTGTCELQENAYQLQVCLPEQLERELETGSVTDNQYIVRDEEKCILCGRCVQTCRTMTGCSVFSLIGNGVNTRVVPYKDGKIVTMEEAGCIFCGLCVDVCPVSALTEKRREAGGREWQLNHACGVCIECSLTCKLERQSAGNNLLKVTVDREGENVAWLCQKGKFGKTTNRENCLTKPLLADNSSFKEADYQEAIGIVGKKLKDAVINSGPESVAILSSGKLSNEEAYLLQKLARNELGINNINLGVDDQWADIYQKMIAITGPATYGPDADLLRHAEAILVIGSGLEKSHPVAAMAIGQAARYGSAVVIRISSEENNLVAWEDIKLITKPGMEQKAILGLTAVLKGENGSKEAKDAGVDETKLQKAAELLTGFNTFTVVSPSFIAADDDSQNDALIEFAQECGHLTKGSSKLLLLSQYSNSSGIINSGGSPFCGPGLVTLNGKAGMSSKDLAEALSKGKIKVLLTFGSGFSTYDTGKTDFVAAFCESHDDLPKKAAIAIPMLPIEKKEGTFTSSSGGTFYNERTADEPTQKEDWLVICDLAGEAGVKWKYAQLTDIQDEIEKVMEK